MACWQAWHISLDCDAVWQKINTPPLVRYGDKTVIILMLCLCGPSFYLIIVVADVLYWYHCWWCMLERKHLQLICPKRSHWSVWSGNPQHFSVKSLLWFKYQSSFNIKPLYLKRHKWKVSHPEALIDLLCVVLLCLVVHGFDPSVCHQWPTIYFTPNVQQNNILLRDSFCISDILMSRNTTCSYGFLTGLKLKPVLSFKWFFQCVKTWKPERICLCACCQLKACLVYWNLFMTRYFCFCLDEFLTLLCKEGIVSFPYRSSQASVFSCACLTLLVASWSDKLKQGKGCGSLTQHSCACFSVPALPFFSKSRGNGLSCPPASRKWVIDNP